MYVVAVVDVLGVSGTVHVPQFSAVAPWNPTPAVSSCATLTTTELTVALVGSMGPVVAANEPIESSDVLLFPVTDATAFVPSWG